MSAAERKRRSRARLAAAGGREFTIKVGGTQMAPVARMAELIDANPSEVFHRIVDNALARYQRVVKLTEAMTDHGASIDEIRAFLRDHLGIERSDPPSR